MENLKVWDRKSKLLEQDLDKFKNSLSNAGSKETQQLKNQFAAVKHERFNLDKNLTYILGSTKKSEYLNTDEAALLHWAKSYAEISQKTYRSFITSITMFLWAKLVEARTYRLRDSMIPDKSPSLSLKYLHSQILRQDSLLQKQLSSIKLKKLNISSRYERLATIKNNQEAYIYMDCVQPGHHPMLRTIKACQDHFLMTRRSITGTRRGYTGQDNSSKLTINPAKNRESNTNRQHNLSPSSEALLEKFDYLNISGS